MSSVIQRASNESEALYKNFSRITYHNVPTFWGAIPWRRLEESTNFDPLDTFLADIGMDFILNLQKEGQDELFESIQHFKYLSYNWDSYGANAIEEVSVAWSIGLTIFLSLYGLFVVEAYPMRDGGIQLELFFDGLGIEIEVRKDSIKLLKFDEHEECMYEKTYFISEIQNIPIDIKRKGVGGENSE